MIRAFIVRFWIEKFGTKVRKSVRGFQKLEQRTTTLGKRIFA
jgi:hypothetical protein